MTPMLISQEVRDLCRIGRTTLHNRTTPTAPGYDAEFPLPHKLSAHRNLWDASELSAYLKGKKRER